MHGVLPRQANCDNDAALGDHLPVRQALLPVESEVAQESRDNKKSPPFVCRTAGLWLFGVMGVVYMLPILEAKSTVRQL
jgi:hypothetical protein